MRRSPTCGRRWLWVKPRPGNLVSCLLAKLLGARNAGLWYTGAAVQPAVLTVPWRADNCLRRRRDVTAQRGRRDHFDGFLARWQAADPSAAGCVTCHGGHTTAGNPQGRLQSTLRVRTVCEACHRALAEGD